MNEIFALAGNGMGQEWETPPIWDGGPGKPEQSDVLAFEEVFDSRVEEVGPVEATEIDGIHPVEPSNLGQVLVEGMHNLSTDHDAKVQKLADTIESATADGEISMRGMLEVQVELANLSFQEQLTVKIADKGSEGIKTLFRNQ